MYKEVNIFIKKGYQVRSKEIDKQIIDDNASTNIKYVKVFRNQRICCLHKVVFLKNINF